MKDTIAKSDWLTALACPAMAWHGLRADPVAPSEADRFRMQQGQEIGALARKLYPDGVMIPAVAGKTPAQITQELLADLGKQTFFEATVAAGAFVAKADILRRQNGGWHVLEVKSRFSDTGSLAELVDDLAYTVMVFRRAGLPVAQASLVLLSRAFRFGDGPDRLFDIVDVTEDAMKRVAEFDGAADAVARTLFHDTPPAPVLVSACRDCDYFDDQCLGDRHRSYRPGNPWPASQEAQTPVRGRHHRPVAHPGRPGAERPPAARDERRAFRGCDHRPGTRRGLGRDFLALPLPRFRDGRDRPAALPGPRLPSAGAHAIQHSSPRRHRRGARHSEYLADAARDCQRDVAEALIAALGDHGAIIVYSGFEKTRITALRDAFPDLAAALDAILGRLVDLLSVITEYVSHPDFKGSYSIKKVLPVLVPELSYQGLAVRDGDTAITRFARMARGEITGSDVAPTRQQLLEYCKLDTFAMLRLHEALVKMAVPQAMGA